ncbi:MAG: hypothetical protein P4L53_15500 [Candidatus Obscuribacterales bacterium]|nr:hypothetical protein [Candidatus Obscuribacterales bacterium]
MVVERLSNLSLGLAVLLSFLVVTIFVSFFATTNSNQADVSAKRDLSVKKALDGTPLLNGS